MGEFVNWAMKKKKFLWRSNHRMGNELEWSIVKGYSFIEAIAECITKRDETPLVINADELKILIKEFVNVAAVWTHIHRYFDELEMEEPQMKRKQFI